MVTSRLVSVFAAVAVGVSSVALFTPFSLFSFPKVSAAQQTATLTVAQTVALFGNSITCEYYATDGTYKQSTATFDGYGSNSIGYTNFVDSSGISLANRQFAYYLMPMPSDYDPTAQSMSILFKTAVDISSLDYFDSALIYSSNIDTSSQLYGTYVSYWYCSDGYHYGARQGASGTSEYNLYGFVRDNSSRQCLAIPVLYQSAANTTFSTGWANIGGWSALSGTNSVAIGIVCPIISENWVFDGSSGAGAGSSSGSGSDSGSGSGADLSGVTSRLDQIISLLDEIADNTSSESSGSSSSDSSADDLVDQFDSDMDYITSGLNQMDGLAAAADSVSFVDAQYTDVYQPVRDLVGVAPSEQSRSGDEGSTEEWLKEELDGVPNPFFVSMQVTALIALISFVIFGKRGGG